MQPNEEYTQDITRGRPMERGKTGLLCSRVPRFTNFMRFWELYPHAVWQEAVPSHEWRSQPGLIVRTQIVPKAEHKLVEGDYSVPGQAYYEAQAWTGFPTYFVHPQMWRGAFWLQALEPGCSLG